MHASFFTRLTALLLIPGLTLTPVLGFPSARRPADVLFEGQALAPPVEFARHFISLGNNRRMTYGLGGNPQAEKVIVYLHGFGGSRRELAMLEHQDVDARIIAVDLPGIGGSSRLPEPWLDLWPDDLFHLITELGVEEFTLVAYSAGGPWALACAASKLLGPRVRAVVGAGALGPATGNYLSFYRLGIKFLYLQTHLFEKYPMTQRFFFVLGWLWMRSIGSDREWLWRSAFELMLVTGQSKGEKALLRFHAGDLHQNWKVAFESGNPAGWLWFMITLSRPWRFRLEAIQCPVDLLHGEWDDIVPIQLWADILGENSNLPNFKLVRLSKERHRFIFKTFRIVAEHALALSAGRAA